MLTELKKRIITIDGLAASGKSTIAKLLAEKIDAVILSTGEAHRINAFNIENKGINYSNEKELLQYINEINIDYFIKNNKICFSIDGIKIDDVLKSRVKNDTLTNITKIPYICNKLTDFFRNIECKKAMVVDGHGVGNGIFPYAMIKFYCDASEVIRAKRRSEQRNEEFDKVLSDIHARDYSDISRKVNPVKIERDMIIINTELIIDECINIVLKNLKNYEKELK